MQPDSQKLSSENNGMRRFQILDATLCEQTRTVRIAGKSHAVTDLTWRFLIALIDAAPDVASYGALSESVWGHAGVSDETMAQRVRQIRRLLGDDPKNPTYVRTIRGQGYQLFAPVTSLPNLTKPKARGDGWFAKVTIGVLFFAGVTALIWSFWIQRSTTEFTANIPHPAPNVIELIARADEYRKRLQVDDNNVSIVLYQEALDAEPDNVDALTGLSFAHSHRTSKFEGSREWADNAADLADRAMLLDPGNAQAWSARGLADDARGRVSSAIQYYQRAFDLDESLTNLITNIAYLRQIQGRLHESLVLEVDALSRAEPAYFSDLQIATALRLVGLGVAADAWLERVERLRPDNVFLLDHKVERHIANGEFDAALNLLNSAGKNRYRQQALLGMTLLALGLREDAVAAFLDGRAIADRKDSRCLSCQAALAAGGAPAEKELAELFLRDAVELVDSGEEWPYFRVQLAYLNVAVNKHATAMDNLNDAVALGYRDWRWLESSPLLDPLKARADFHLLVERIRAAIAVEREKILGDETLEPLLRPL